MLVSLFVKPMLGFSFFIVFVIIFQTDASLNFSCKDVQNHKNYHLLTSPAKCLPVKPSTRIMGGTDAKLGEFPWMAVLFIKDPGIYYSYCDGSIISSKYVLTAARCLTDVVLKPGKLIIGVGEYDLDKVKNCNGTKCSYDKAKEYDTDHHLIHPDFDNKKKSNYKNDIGLVRVKGEITFNEFVYPACLPTSCNLMKEHLVGKLVTGSGWGHNLKVRSHILQKVETSVAELSLCQNIYSVSLLESQLCVGGNKSKDPWLDACKADWGGPLMYTSPLDGPSGQEYYVQIGMMSWGVSCECSECKKYPFNVYTKVVSYLIWILDNISA